MQFIRLHANAKDLTNRKFGRLTAVGPVSSERAGKATVVIWMCRCDCGKVLMVRSAYLLSGDTASCGCLKHDLVAKRNFRHGHSQRGAKSKEYKAWCNMISRCTNPNTDAYHWYGERGITVCDRWRLFENFIHDMGPMPTRQHTIERVDVDGNYEPKNVIWATRLQQGANKRNNRMLAAFGETMHMQEWCRKTGLNQRTLWDRLDTGWPTEEALSTPLLRKKA